MNTKEATERVKARFDKWALDDEDLEAMKVLIPELAESEDERVRTRLIALVESFGQGTYKNEMLAYLEKQKEQKPTEWSDSVAKEMFIKALERAVEQTKKGYELTDCDKHSWWEDFKAYSIIKPAEWSEENEQIYNEALDALYYKDCNDKDDVLSALKGLCDLIADKRKVIPPYQRWKPSEEQMEALRKASDLLVSDLNSLYNDLTKQM